MDARQEEGSKVVAKECLIAPSCGSPRRLLFRLRRRSFTFDGSPSLLISNRFGVWSVAHRRYIRKSRYHRYMELRRLLLPVKTQYAALEKKLHLSQRPEAAELRAARQKLADLYWSAMPEEKKAGIVRFFYRDQRDRRRKLYAFAVLTVLMAVLGLMIMRRILLLPFYLDWVQVVVTSVYFLVLSLCMDCVVSDFKAIYCTKNAEAM
ncbi:hypothetical protein ACP4OV_023285 [Aristida adscensionis]